MNFDLRYYVSVAWRRLPIFLPIAIVLAGVSVFVALSLPAKYQSSSTLLLESAQISDNLAQSTVSVDPNEQLQIVEQRLMTRANLLDSARKFEVFKNIDTMSADEIVREMRSATRIGVRSGRNQATRMTLTFSSREPVISASVLNEYITTILNESAKFRKSRAEGTLEFFEQEVERLSRDLDQQSSRIMGFQSENSDALPSTLGYRLGRQGQLQERTALNERERISLEEQKQRLTQLYELTTAQAEKERPASRLQQQLDQMNRELNQALLIYSRANPRVKLLQGRIDALAIEVENEVVEDEGETPQDALFLLQIDEIDQKIAGILERNEATSAEISRLQESIERTAGNEIALDALEREYGILESQYNAAVSRLSTAATGERIEVLSKGERITIVEQPSVADEPTSPNRPLVAGAGSLAGFGFAAAIVILLELLNNAVRRPADLTARFGITPLGVLPVIRTPGDRLIKGGTMLAAVAIVVIGVPAALFAVHTYYLPLDLLAEQALTKLGI